MGKVFKKILKGEAAWKGPELSDGCSWIWQLTDREIGAIDDALCYLKAVGGGAAFKKEDFPLYGIESWIAGVNEELENGKGFLLIRGLDANKYDENDLAAIYYGIGLHMGVPVSQNPKGDMLGVVKNVGDVNDKRTRVYETNSYLPYHTDIADVVGLLSINKAKTGGLSSLVSAAAIYNSVLEEAPELLEVLYSPFYFSHIGDSEYTPCPIFSYHDGKLSCRYLRQYIELGHELKGEPLLEEQKDALDLVDEIIHRGDIKLDMMLEPGDIQFANNYMVLHSRTAFEDYNDDQLKRKLLRLWLKMPNSRNLAPNFPGRNGFSD
ncbi:TauD/TfdA family dioxygenase [Halomonas halocynthiae]|uniref:TauD/TfdA family dioxygenase n=1 Tax=Halomonas halocynthiae TaxID=176290 RepID=UPI0004058213|nr:TauD/TfdA family dioxygenase [Halomonas halocynthiae]